MSTSFAHATTLIGSRRAKWDAAVLAELALSGRMELLPVADARGRIADFVCVTASPSVTQLLGELSGAPVGLRLSKLLANHPGRDELLSEYLSVADSGRSSCCRTVSVCSDERLFLLHDISRTANRVLVVHLIPGRG